MSTTSAHWQQEAALVAEDVQHADHEDDKERLELKLSSYGRKVEKFGRPTPEIEGLVVVTGLSPMIACSLETRTFHSFETLRVNDVVFLLVELLEVSSEEARAETSGSYAWGATALVHMYENLNDASKSTTRQLVRYITLLQTSAHATCDTFVEPDVAQHPVAATTMDEAPKDAYPDVEQP
ncbi:hypothetical protein HKD37_07G018876 [Glycine soja]